MRKLDKGSDHTTIKLKEVKNGCKNHRGISLCRNIETVCSIYRFRKDIKIDGKGLWGVMAVYVDGKLLNAVKSYSNESSVYVGLNGSMSE